MRVLIYIFIALAIGLFIFNATKLDMDNLFTGNSAVAITGMVASLCVILLMVILAISRKINNNKKR